MSSKMSLPCVTLPVLILHPRLTDLLFMPSRPCLIPPPRQDTLPRLPTCQPRGLRGPSLTATRQGPTGPLVQCQSLGLPLPAASCPSIDMSVGCVAAWHPLCLGRRWLVVRAGWGRTAWPAGLVFFGNRPFNSSSSIRVLQNPFSLLVASCHLFYHVFHPFFSISSHPSNSLACPWFCLVGFVVVCSMQLSAADRRPYA